MLIINMCVRGHVCVRNVASSTHRSLNTSINSYKCSPRMLTRKREENTVQCKCEQTNKHRIDIRNTRQQLEKAVEEARDLTQRIKDEVGCPGLAVAVSVDGEFVLSEGLGYSDVENRVKCSPAAIMRIGSISKCITMTAVARLWEAGKLDIDKPVETYVPTWPQKTYKGEKVSVTTRHILSHKGGIRNYEKDCGKGRKISSEKVKEENTLGQIQSLNTTTQREHHSQTKCLDKNTEEEILPEDEYAGYVRSEQEMGEFYIKDKYVSIEKSLQLFKDDELCNLPGTEFLYSDHGWTLVTAVIEGVVQKPFTQYIKHLFNDLGMNNTYLDDNEQLIYNRSRYYLKSKKGRLENAPFVDNSCRYGSGGFLSTAEDLCKFGNAMLYSYQHDLSTAQDAEPGYLKQETVKVMWTPVENTQHFWNPEKGYGMGWFIVPYRRGHGQCPEQRFVVHHNGAAIGASSAMLILPRKENQGRPLLAPAGVVVAIMCNMQNARFNRRVEQIAEIFDKV